jgi:hypothetical protein
VDPQFLALNREVDNATFATNLLDTDYLVDNGYLQVREDGGYLGRHNPEFLAKIRNEYYPFPFFNFDNNATKIVFQKGTQTMIVHVSDLPVVEMHLEQTANSESIVVTHGNSLFSYTQKVTLYAGSVLADVTETFMAHSADVAFVTVQFDIATKSSIAPIVSGDHSGVGLVDKGMKTMAQISFPTAEAKPNEISVPPESKNYSPIGLTYALNLAQQVKFSFYMGTYQYQDSDIAQIESGVSSYPEMVNGYMTQKLAQMQSLPSIGQADFVVFDYKKELAARQVGYVIVFKNPGMQPKFTLDPQYSLVFINEEAAIYRVNQ